MDWSSQMLVPISVTWVMSTPLYGSSGAMESSFTPRSGIITATLPRGFEAISDFRICDTERAASVAPVSGAKKEDVSITAPLLKVSVRSAVSIWRP